MEKRIIKLPQGGDLELECTPEFYDVVKNSMMISDDEEITDEILREFIYTAFKNGIDKAEQDLIAREADRS